MSRIITPNDIRLRKTHSPQPTGQAAARGVAAGAHRPGHPERKYAAVVRATLAGGRVIEEPDRGAGWSVADEEGEQQT